MLLPKPKKLQKRLAESRTRIDQLQTDGYRVGWSYWEELGRCYYYLRDPQATEHLRQAAVLVVQSRRSVLNPNSNASLFLNASTWFYAANLYRLIGDRNAMADALTQLRSYAMYPVWQEWPSPVEFYWDLLTLAALMEGDAPKALHYDAKIAALPKRKNPARPWSGRLAEAIVQADVTAIRAIGSELHGLLIRYHGKPWDTDYLNLWDWYEFTDQVADKLEAQQ